MQSEHLQKIRKEARRVLEHNYNATGGRYITPAWPNYKNQWVWDSAFHAISCASLGMKDLAINEIRQLFRFQDERGFIPHRIYHDVFVWHDLERPIYNRGGWKPESSSLVGQPVLAQAVEAIGDEEFTQETIEGLVGFYKYFIEYRDALNIISMISPRESGRDAAPEYDFFRPTAPRKLRFLERILDPAFVLLLGYRYYRNFKRAEGGPVSQRQSRSGWDERKILDSCIFNVKDVAIHCLWIDGLYSLRGLLEQTGRKDELFSDIDNVIDRAVEVLIEKAWNEEDKTFYHIRVTKKGEEQIKMLSLGSLFPLLIKDLPHHIVSATMNHLTDPEKFWTPHPVPVVPKTHPKFEPITTFPIWASGQVWINANWFLVRGLMRHERGGPARVIAERTVEMTAREGFCEFYNSLTGEGMRMEDFGWSTLAVTLPDIVR